MVSYNHRLSKRKIEYEKMIATSLLSKGNNKRLKAAIKKAQRGDDVTIAYIGGLTS
jgi:hypothetical protein